MEILNLKTKTAKIFIVFALLFVSIFNLSSQENQNSKSDYSILGIWENGGRFIEFSKDASDNMNMRIVLKPYYRFVYDDASKIRVDVRKIENSNAQFYLTMKYALTRNSVSLPICVENDSLFTSFYKRVKYTENNEDPDFSKRTTPLEGFWIEQGNQNGILLYPNEIPKSIDAYFFSGNSYMKFRYWLDDLEYNTKKAIVKGRSGKSYEFPKLLKRGKFVYSCITSNGSKLRNFETGTYTINKDNNAANGKGLSLTFNKQGAGPGSDAASDTYPDKRFIVMENLPLYILDDNQVFAIGDAYLFRSKVLDLNKEIEKHNSKRRK